jgi:lysophospholipase L1-like esterase
LKEAEVWVNRFNHRMSRLSVNRVHFVQLYDAFLNSDDPLLSDDLVHPNTAGYDVISRELFQTGVFVRCF